MLKEFVINFLKKHFYGLKVFNQLSATTQLLQLQQIQYYKKCLKNKSLPSFNETGFKVFSQFEEDGKLLYIFSIIGFGNKTFVDLGSNDCVNSNCANLVIHHNWKGLFVDGDKKLLAIGKKFYDKYPNPWSYKPKFSHSFITKNNVNEIIKNQNIEGEIDFLSIDIDGNDYWIWKALTIIEPKVVVIESQVAFGLHDLIVPYNEKYTENIENNFYCGASTLAIYKLAKSKNYRLIGANEYGNNLFFIKNGIAEVELPEISFESTLKHPFASEKFLSKEILEKLIFETE